MPDPSPPVLLRAFAGIGSRATPADALDLLRMAAQHLVDEGWTCRSGGADGADTACETGALAALYDDLSVGPEHATRGALEVYLPWGTFGRGADWYAYRARYPAGALNLRVYTGPTQAAVALAAAAHPAWGACSPAARKLHGRTSHQLLGRDLRSPVACVLCWTPDGALGTPEAPVTRETGGTGQAIRLAAARGIPVMNLARPDHRARVLAKISPPRLQPIPRDVPLD
jgi:hypothetical protein